MLDKLKPYAALFAVAAAIAILFIFSVGQASQAAYNDGVRHGQAMAASAAYDQGYQKGYSSAAYDMGAN